MGEALLVVTAWNTVTTTTVTAPFGAILVDDDADGTRDVGI